MMILDYDGTFFYSGKCTPTTNGNIMWWNKLDRFIEISVYRTISRGHLAVKYDDY